MLSAAADRHANGVDNYRTSDDKLHPSQQFAAVLDQAAIPETFVVATFDKSQGVSRWGAMCGGLGGLELLIPVPRTRRIREES
jgi:hypothetical protein